MDELDDQGQRLLEWLVGKLAAAVPGDPRTYVSYRDAHVELGLEMRGSTDGISLQGQGLNSLAEWTKVTKKPGITGQIINRESLEPGPGYFKLFNKKQTDYPWWEQQIRLSKEFDWAPFLGSITEAKPLPAPKGKVSPPPPPPTPEASDLQPPCGDDHVPRASRLRGIEEGQGVARRRLPGVRPCDPAARWQALR
jgi:hypothetical protein